jgi:hypothetical protein
VKAVARIVGLTLLVVAAGCAPSDGTSGPDSEGAATRSGDCGKSRGSVTQDRWKTSRTVASEPGRFKGWPANGGMWGWGDEMVVMYGDGTLDPSNPRGHAIDRSQPLYVEQARTLDGGRTWHPEPRVITKPGPPGYPWSGLDGPTISDLTEPVDFRHPDLALHFRAADYTYGASYWYYSYNRARTWQGPFRLPLFGLATVNARTDYIVNGPHDAMVFLSGSATEERPSDAQGFDGSRTFMVRTSDGGVTWQFVANTSRVASGGGEGGVKNANMPSTARLSPTRLLSLSRNTDEPPGRRATGWIDAYLSEDDGRSWRFLSRVGSPFPFGSTPPALTRLCTGDLVVTYGYRVDRRGRRALQGDGAGYGVRARVSRDEGVTWSDEVVLRDDGATWDLGYTRNQARPDGTIVTVYYFNRRPAGERTIDATVWDPVAAFDLSSSPPR